MTFPDPNFWQNMSAWLYQVTAQVQMQYGVLLLVPAPTVFQLPFTDTLSGLSTVEEFQVYCVQLQQYFPVATAQYVANAANPAGFAAALVFQMFNYYSAPIPQPLPKPAPPVAAPAAPPANPIGPSFISGTETDYTDEGSPSIAIGGTYTNSDPTYPLGVYTKQGKRNFMGIMQTWWTFNASPSK